MDYEAAVEELTFHCGTNPNIDDPRWNAGFLQTLRPYSGRLDADAFQAFKEKGLFDRETGLRFREHILARGGSEDPMVLYKRFRGKEPSIEPLLERRGLM